MTFREEFPTFNPDTLPAIPEGWTDNSWHNNACPSFNTGRGHIVFVDFADPADRDNGPEIKRFSVQVDPEIANVDDPLLDTDDWQEVIAFLIGEAFADVLRETLTTEQFEQMKAQNETDPHHPEGACASQNYCDAFVAMDVAFGRVLGRQFKFDDDDDAALWNAAWEGARKRHIGWPREAAQ